MARQASGLWNAPAACFDEGIRIRRSGDTLVLSLPLAKSDIETGFASTAARLKRSNESCHRRLLR
jgi:hypothetical protein